MSQEVQVDHVGTSTVIHRSSSAETITFGLCSICEVNTHYSSEETEEHVVIINNLVLIKCCLCNQMFHMKCLQEQLDLSMLLDIVETGYSCVTCRD